MWAINGNVPLTFLVEYLYKSLVHLQANLLPFTGAILDKGKIRNSQP